MIVKKCEIVKRMITGLYFYRLRVYIFLFLFFISGQSLFAQQQVRGLIIDSNTKQRISSAYFYNTGNETGYFSNLKGEFTLSANPGDVLILAKEGYFPDTITIQNKTTVLIELRRSSIWLRDVHVMAKKSPQQMLEQNEGEYEDAYKRGKPGSLLSSGSGGVGLSINALYSLISREGKNARYLQEIIERDYRDAIIDYRFTPFLVKSLTNLEGAKLADFMFYYRPSYYFVLNSNDYMLGQYIKRSFEEYRRNPDARKAEKFPEAEINIK